MKNYLISMTSLLLFLFVGCATSENDDSTAYGNWSRQSDFEGVARSSAVSFVIGDYAYVGLGTDGDRYLLDFWRYDPELNFWKEMKSFPGIGRTSSISFAANGKGYVGTGYNRDLDTEELADFWEYDPNTNEWLQKADFSGGPRYGATAFSIDNVGYVGTGYDGNYLKDFWKYDTQSNSWTQTISIGSKRERSFSFVIDGIAYVGGGRNNGSRLYDFYAFDPLIENWINKTLYDEDDTYDEFFAAVSRYSTSTFTIDGLGFVACGISDSYSTAVYAYDPKDNSWTGDYTSFEYSARGDAVGFSMNGKGYVATGSNGSYRFDDIWSFQPNEEYDEYQ